MMDTNAYLSSNDDNERDVVHLAAHLCALGYDARVEHTDVRETRRYLQSAMRHEFIVVRIPEEDDQQSAEEYTVDIRFKEQFSMPRPTSRYVTALNLVPEAFVGTRARLLSGARAVWREMELAFAYHGMTPLPPWRKEDRFLARWCPEEKKAGVSNTVQQYREISDTDRRADGENILRQVRTSRERENMDGEIKKQLRRMDEFNDNVLWKKEKGNGSTRIDL